MMIVVYLLSWAVIIILAAIGQELEVALLTGIMMMLFFILNELHYISEELRNR